MEILTNAVLGAIVLLVCWGVLGTISHIVMTSSERGPSDSCYTVSAMLVFLLGAWSFSLLAAILFVAVAGAWYGHTMSKV